MSLSMVGGTPPTPYQAVQRTWDDAMAFQSVPETAEIVIKYELHGEEMFNVLHARLAGGYVVADLLALANAIDASVPVDWLPIQTQDCTYVQTTVRGLEFENDLEVLANLGSANGTAVSVAMPGNVTLSVKKGSNFTGRSARGRLYWIGAPRDQLSGNENFFLSTYASSVTTAVETLRQKINLLPWLAVIVSRWSGGVKRDFGETFPWITVSVVNTNVDSARRRLSP